MNGTRARSAARRCGQALRVKGVVLWIVLFIVGIGIAGCGGGQPGAGGHGNKPTLVFGDGSWDSVQLHNRIAAFLIQHGFGYPVDYKFGDTVPILQGLQDGSIHITMEIWPANTPDAWEKAVSSGQVLDLGPNFPNAPQGWYVPAYVVKGDPQRGIQPMAPDLRSVEDLKRYWQLFEDPTEPGKGRFYNCTTGWVCEEINRQKLEAYGLTEHYTAFNPGSEAGLNTSIVTAYEQGKPWLGYYWEPTWITGKYDLIRLEEPRYSDQCWNTDRACAYPASQVLVAANQQLRQMAPDVLEFLEKYETTVEQTSAALAYMEEQQASPEEAALWFLKTYDQWRQWLPDDAVERVEQALRGGGR